ncbi:MAG TPA: dTMP kinase [Clostridiales bacterium]|nr:dTMP kinase [Clostridiales bacterium]
MERGLFISVEGIDGSGKTTQIGLMKSYLEEKGYEVIVTREPGGTSIGEKIRSILLDPQNSEMDQVTEMLLYASARAQIIHELIKPAIDKGKIVICDRFLDSSYAYQGYGRGIDIELITRVNSVAVCGIMPDITFLFDIVPETALKRRFASSTPDRIEREELDFYTRVYNGYKELAALYPERIKIISTDKSPEDVFSIVKRNLHHVLNSTL